MLTALAAAIGAILYRLRGGLLKTLIGTTSTQLSRMVWALPTALLMTWQGGLSPWLGVAALVTVFASMALLGHGAHMVYGKAYWDVFGFQPDPRRQTELLTSWWLPSLFNGLPGEIDWDQDRVDVFNGVGMSFIGFVRNALAALPLALVSPLGVALYALTGLTHGPLYWLGWKVTPDIRAAECLVGASSWAAIVLIF